jgi:cyclopropane fatty-acyl-phospholipid synthase-like methyltransferase
MKTPVALYDSTYGDFQADVLAAVRQKTYDEDLGQTGWLTAVELERFLSWLKLDAGNEVLDIASGSGGLAQRLAATLQVRVTGFDINPHAFEAAQKSAETSGLQSHLSFQQLDANEPLPYTDNSFDVAISIDAMNHITNRSGILTECYRVLKRGGRLLFTDPVVVTGCVTKEELDLCSSIGPFLFAPLTTTQELIAKTGLRLVVCEDVSDNMATVSKRWHDARAARRKELVALEGARTFRGIQEFLTTVRTVARERRLSRYVFVAEKP